MRPITLIAIYFVVWWLVLFAVLPFGVRTQDEEEAGTVIGTPASAPNRPMLMRKALITSVVAAIVVGGIWLAHVRFGVSVDSIARMFGVSAVE
jgi:predicted secreted protein